MICSNCKNDLAPEYFYKTTYSNKLQTVCKFCKNKITQEYHNESAVDEMRHKINHMKELLREIIESCDCNNGRRLRLCVEKARIEVGKYKIKGGSMNV